MRFEQLPLAAAEGHLLGHNIAGADGRRVLRKGKPLAAADIETLAALGRRSVFVARLEADDVLEDEAARRLGQRLAGPGIRLTAPKDGRVDLHAETLGVLRADTARIRTLNAIGGVGLALVPPNRAVSAGALVANLKILPFALPESVVQEAEALLAAAPLLSLTALPPRRVGLVLSGSASARETLERGFGGALGPRLEALGASLEAVSFVSLDDEGREARLADALGAQLEAGLELLIMAGETAIMDHDDLAPRAIVRAGGVIECFGAPVFPGNLMLLAYHDAVPIFGAPSCARSPKENIVDLLLPRLLAGERLGHDDIAAFGIGGLLADRRP